MKECLVGGHILQRDFLGIYISIPFCKAKCSFCNFASGVFAPGRMSPYVNRVCGEIRSARARAARLGAQLPEMVDTVYFGGGTPSLLEPEHLRQMLGVLREEFVVQAEAEITLESAPGQVGEELLETALVDGVNRMSFGVQSFVDLEARAAGRMHTGAECHAEIARMQRAGVPRLSLDLIAGLPLQTEESWRYSVEQAIETGVDHLSVYLLEVDEDSRLGREALAGGRRYGASLLPTDDAAADWYGEACSMLASAGLAQYEISNFARQGFASRHNRKYWQRDPYLGFGLDAHSMLFAGEDGTTAVRWANPDVMEAYEDAGGGPRELPLLTTERGAAVDWINVEQAFEESLFLGMRMNAGVDLDRLESEFGRSRVDQAVRSLGDVEQAGLVERAGSRVALTASGRLASNEVFSRLLANAG